MIKVGKIVFDSGRCLTGSLSPISDTPSPKISIRIDSDLLHYLKIIAHEQGISVSKLIKNIINEYCRTKQQKTSGES